MLTVDEEEKLSKAAWLGLRDQWIDKVNQNDRLSHATTRVGTFIALRMNASSRQSNWPVEKIAKMLPSRPDRRMSTSTVSKAIAELLAENLLVVHRPNRRRNQAYSLHFPFYVETRKSRHSETRKSKH